MDTRIRGEVSKEWDKMCEYEYLIVEEIYESLGGGPCRLVDVGCGSKGLLGRKEERHAALQAHSLGIDIDREALATNPNVTHRTCASCYSLPLKSNSVDIIVCRWVLEHLETPERAFSEFARVLKKGGRLYIKTPNLWNPVIVLSRMTPTAFHNLLNRLASVNGAAENTATLYRANTKRRLRELATNSGFTVRRLESYSYAYNYFLFNKELFLAMRRLSELVGKVTDRTQLTLLCVLEKIQ